MTLKLYYVPDTCSLASHIALIEAGAPYEAVRMSFASADQKQPDYLALNPKGRVPALLTEHGVLTETPALLAYIAQRYPAAQLAPLDDAYAFARVQAFNSYLCSTVHVAHAHRMRGSRWVDASDQAAITAMQKKAPRAVSECFALIERHMFTGPWVMGAHYSVCDAYLYTLAQWWEADGVDPQQLPRLREHRERMAARPAVRRALAEEFA